MEHIISKYLNGELGQIIYVGVGNSPALETILPLAYKSLQLIEPIDTIYEKLDKKFASESVQVKNMAISSAGGTADFIITQPISETENNGAGSVSAVVPVPTLTRRARCNTLLTARRENLRCRLTSPAFA